MEISSRWRMARRRLLERAWPPATTAAGRPRRMFGSRACTFADASSALCARCAWRTRRQATERGKFMARRTAEANALRRGATVRKQQATCKPFHGDALHFPSNVRLFCIASCQAQGTAASMPEACAYRAQQASRRAREGSRRPDDGASTRARSRHERSRDRSRETRLKDQQSYLPHARCFGV